MTEPQPPGAELEVRPENLPEPAPVVEGEIVDESPKTLTQRWARAPRVPVVFKPTSLVPDAKAARRDLAIRSARAPVTTMPRAVARGVVVAARLWWHFIVLYEEREHARKDNKLHEKGPGLREASRRRWKGTGLALLALVVVGLLLRFVFPATAPLVLWPALAALLIALMLLGRAKDGTPGRKPVLGGRGFGWTMNPEMLNDAYRHAKLIKKDQVLLLVKHAYWDGKGWLIVFDLPPGVKASDVVREAEAVASALALDEICLSIERVRGDEGHAGRVSQWASPKDPFGGAPHPFALARAERWDVWKPAPFGHDKRDRPVPLSLVWSSLLIGAQPRKGKTFTARVAISPYVLDPHVRIYCWNGKGDRAWKAIKDIAYRYGKGHSDAECIRLRDALAGLQLDVMGRFDRMDELDDDECPDGKITREMSRNGYPITVVNIDELQNYTDCGAPGWPERGKKATVGQNIATLLTYLAKTAPSAGVVLLLQTQRPDSVTLPTGLRSQMGHRFALKVMDWRDSNIILGEQMNTRGYDASLLLGTHLGVGILRPDGELAAVDAGFPTVQVDWMTGREWTALCQRGRTLREETRTLAGDAAGQFQALDVAQARAALDEAAEPEPDALVIDNPDLPEPLRSVVGHLGDDLDPDGRTFVPTAELVEELGLTAEALAAGMKADPIGLAPGKGRMPGERDQVRGYRTADIRSVVERLRNDGAGGTVIEMHR
jgi:S-DNA-T family DNA segregation ATPase FtsK/SpoIIIE